MATRGGGEWEPIKIPPGNLTYIPESVIQHVKRESESGYTEVHETKHWA
jgi:hypothetical protein